VNGPNIVTFVPLYLPAKASSSADVPPDALGSAEALGSVLADGELAGGLEDAGVLSLFFPQAASTTVNIRISAVSSIPVLFHLFNPISPFGICHSKVQI
jgi:hypothetical protein